MRTTTASHPTHPGGRAWRSTLALPLVALVWAAGSVTGPGQAVASPGAFRPSIASHPVAQPATSPLRLVANVPAYRLDAYLEGDLAASFPVTVGTARNPTPIGNYQIEKMIWNPWWHPPAHRRPADRVTPPGPRNPMGRVKIHFSSLYYFHGTALEDEIGRATSRGCIRLRNDDAITLGRMINDHVGRPLSVGELDALIARPGRTLNVALPTPIPVTLLYQQVELRYGRIHVHEDIYRRASRPVPELVIDALAEAGISRSEVDMEAVMAAVAAPRPTAFAVEEVLLSAVLGA